MNTPYEWVIIIIMSLLMAGITRYIVSKEQDRNKADAMFISCSMSALIMFATLV